MQRLTSGRRYPRAGSVPVTELIRKQPPVLDIRAIAPAMRSSVVALDRARRQVAPTTHRKPPSRAARIAKGCGLALAGVMLCGSVAVASMITHRRGTTAEQATVPSAQIAGERAMLPWELTESVAAAQGDVAPTLTGPVRHAATGSFVHTAPPAPSSSVSKASTSSSRPVVSKIDVVDQFYRTILADPSTAYKLLDATAFSTDLADFLLSWSWVRQIDVLDIHQSGKDVFASVQWLLPDGTHLRVQELLQVTDSLPRRISGAQVLSAQRS